MSDSVHEEARAKARVKNQAAQGQRARERGNALVEQARQQRMSSLLGGVTSRTNEPLRSTGKVQPPVPHDLGAMQQHLWDEHRIHTSDPRWRYMSSQHTDAHWDGSSSHDHEGGRLHEPR